MLYPHTRSLLATHVYGRVLHGSQAKQTKCNGLETEGRQTALLRWTHSLQPVPNSTVRDVAHLYHPQIRCSFTQLKHETDIHSPHPTRHCNVGHATCVFTVGVKKCRILAPRAFVRPRSVGKLSTMHGPQC